jgi:hypothetical protein
MSLQTDHPAAALPPSTAIPWSGAMLRCRKCRRTDSRCHLAKTAALAHSCPAIRDRGNWHMTTKHLPLIIVAVLLAGCGNIQGQLDREKISSLHYDTVECPALIAQKNSAMAEISSLTNGAGYREPSVITGFGPILPDYRTANQKKAGALQGQVDSMTRSIARRKCTG